MLSVPEQRAALVPADRFDSPVALGTVRLAAQESGSEKDTHTRPPTLSLCNSVLKIN